MELNMVARTGRDKQRYKATIRLCAGTIPVRNGKILLVTSRRKPVWGFPKGGWENDESCQECAIRESKEEAGVTGIITHSLGQHSHYSNSCCVSSWEMFILQVDREYEHWPEESERQRKWCTIEEALLLPMNMTTSYFLQEYIKFSIQCQ
ncbi:hypothetical protein WA158_002049 [Blastocystis sp. Blastoise]